MEAWTQRLERAKEVKRIYFQDVADRLWATLTRNYSEVWVGDYPDPQMAKFFYAALHPTTFRPRFNKCREFVQIYLPFLAARVPTITVTPRRPTLTDQLKDLINALDTYYRVELSTPITHCLRPELESAATLLEWYLNYACQELDLETELRMATVEALVKGRGVVWHEIVQHNGRPIVGAFFDSVDRFLVDPDTVFLRDAAWIARIRVVPSWWVRATLKLPEDVVQRMPRTDPLTFNPNSSIMQVSRTSAGASGSAPDAVWFYEIWSRIGAGSFFMESDLPGEMRVAMEALGQYVYLLIAPGVEFPLNMHPDFLATATAEEIQAKAEWPLRLGNEVNDPWPCTTLDFYPNLDNPWATSPLEAGMVFQFFLDLLYGHILNRAAHSARVILAVADDLPEEAVEGLIRGRDMEVVRIPRHEIRDLASAIAPVHLPEVSATLWGLIHDVERQFEKAVGLDPLLYGASQRPQVRSATEIQVREKYVSSRPEDMADRVERWVTRIAQKMAVAARLYIRAVDVAPLFNEPQTPIGPLSQFWDQHVAVENADEAASELQLGVEAGSGRRKNREYLAAVAQLALQQLGPVAMEALARGNPVPFNRLVRFLARTIDADFNEFTITKEEIAAMRAEAQAAAMASAGQARAPAKAQQTPPGNGSVAAVA